MKIQFTSQDLEFAQSLSTVIRVGNDLWLGGDEGTQTMCFRPTGNDPVNPVFTKVAQSNLVVEFDLPGTLPDEDNKLPEVDLEGMDWDAAGGYLWMVGSHSLKRKAAKPGKEAADSLEQDLKNLGRLGKISADGNRFLLGRLPLRVTDGVSQAVPSANQTPNHFSARLDCSETSSTLLDALRSDPLLGRFVTAEIPGKDNGVDIEGLAWDGVRKRLLIGLRGPVLRGMSIILELEVKERFLGAEIAGRLDLQPIGPGGRLYLRHFLDLDGLAVRDLCFQGDDLLILAGPTMPIDWPVSIYRWKNARGMMNGTERFVWQEKSDLELVIEHQLAHSTRKKDHPEALTLLDDNKLLIVCDSPSAPRLSGNVYSPDEAVI